MMFHNKPLPQFDFNDATTKLAVERAFDGFVYPTKKLYGTAVGAALDAVVDGLLTEEAGHRSDSPALVLVLTDGRSQETDAVVAAAGQRLRDTGATVFALGITDAVDALQLVSIAGSAGQAGSSPPTRLHCPACFGFGMNLPTSPSA